MSRGNSPTQLTLLWSASLLSLSLASAAWCYNTALSDLFHSDFLTPVKIPYRLLTSFAIFPNIVKHSLKLPRHALAPIMYYRMLSAPQIRPHRRSRTLAKFGDWVNADKFFCGLDTARPQHLEERRACLPLLQQLAPACQGRFIWLTDCHILELTIQVTRLPTMHQLSQSGNNRNIYCTDFLFRTLTADSLCLNSKQLWGGDSKCQRFRTFSIMRSAKWRSRTL